MNVQATVIDLASNILSGEKREINAAFRLTRDNQVAPIDVAELAIRCEREFGFPLHDERIAQWETIGDVCACIEEGLEEGLGEKAIRTEDERTGWFYQ